MPPEVTSIQPGGGFCMACELAWGRARRWYLHRFRPAYVDLMRQSRTGNVGTYPHEILDPRDLKFCRNQGDLAWRDEDDPFAWRGRLGVARVGWAEIVLLGGTLVDPHRAGTVVGLANGVHSAGIGRICGLFLP